MSSPPAASLLDISLPLSAATPVFPGDPPFELLPLASLEEAGCRLSAIRMGTHTGTHLDAPAHVLQGGATVDALPAELLVGPARIVDLSDVGPALSASVLARRDLAGARRLLLRTRRGPRPGRPAAHLTLDGALHLRSLGVRLVGIDELSIGDATEGSTLPVHHALLGADPPVLVLEGLDLSAAREGEALLLCLPLRLVGADGAPARVLLALGGLAPDGLSGR
jgi:arylformamidase